MVIRTFEQLARANPHAITFCSQSVPIRPIRGKKLSAIFVLLWLAAVRGAGY
jgi:hypothetical protein